jgi:DNA repair exonuclease SbcCD nuclease subunit
MRILHFSDLHLDRSFAALGMASSEAAKRREELRAALRRIVDLAIERDVDVLTVGGDLYEHDRVTRDTANFMREQFARVAPRPVLIAPGNHDPYVPDGLYWRLEWPENVHIFESMSWDSVQVGDVAVWGVGHRGLAIRDNLLGQLRIDRPGTHIALFHGSDMSSVPEGKDAHCPFDRADVERCGADFVLLGHYHEMRLRPDGAPRYGYPGSPEPLSFGEEGPHYVFVVNASPGRVDVEPIQINEVAYQTKTVDVTGLASSDSVREAIAALGGDDLVSGAITRVLLAGPAEPELDLDLPALYAGTAQCFRYLDLVNRTHLPFDLDQIREEPTTRGAFVRLIEAEMGTAAGAGDDVLKHALQYGLQAFAGQGIRRR